MKQRTVYIYLLVIVGMLLLYTPALWAGDCSEPSDCGAIPDNGTKAAVCGGILIGCGLYERKRRKDKEKPSEDEGDATDENALFGTADPGGSPDNAAPDPPTSAPSPSPRGVPDGPLGDPGDLPSGGSGGDSGD